MGPFTGLIAPVDAWLSSVGLRPDLKGKPDLFGHLSGISLDGGILIVDIETGKSPVDESYPTRFRSGGRPLSLIGVVPGALLSLRTITNGQMVRAVDDLARHLVASVPNLLKIGPLHGVAESVASAGDAYRVQVAAFRSSSEAQHAVQFLRAEGY